MWIDERGSEVLDLPECRRLLALGAKQGRHGHLAVATSSAPNIYPLNYQVHRHDVLVMVGQGLFDRVCGKPVAFEVDALDHPSRDERESARPWSVVVRGLATEEEASSDVVPPRPAVADPGERLLRIRADVVTGRRLPGQSAPDRDPTNP